MVKFRKSCDTKPKPSPMSERKTERKTKRKARYVKPFMKDEKDGTLFTNYDWYPGITAAAMEGISGVKVGEGVVYSMAKDHPRVHHPVRKNGGYSCFRVEDIMAATRQYHTPTVVALVEPVGEVRDPWGNGECFTDSLRVVGLATGEFTSVDGSTVSTWLDGSTVSTWLDGLMTSIKKYNDRGELESYTFQKDGKPHRADGYPAREYIWMDRWMVVQYSVDGKFHRPIHIGPAHIVKFKDRVTEVSYYEYGVEKTFAEVQAARSVMGLRPFASPEEAAAKSLVAGLDDGVHLPPPEISKMCEKGKDDHINPVTEAGAGAVA